MPEDILQQMCIGYLNKEYPDIVVNVSLSGIKLNGKDKFTIINAMKRAGWVKGIADITLHLPKGVTLCLELKTERGKQSKEQIEVENKLMKLGHNYLVVRSLDMLKEIMREYYTME